MEYETAKKILATSSQSEWVVDDESGSFTYKNDMNLRIERADFNDYEIFNEPWATKHPDKNAKSVMYTVKYNNSIIERIKLVTVDGFRATLPMPISQTNLSVSKKDVNFAEIVDIGNRVREYLSRSKISISD